MWITVFPRIRRQMFELFFYTHQLYFLFLLFYVLHVGIVVFSLILPGVYLFLIDRYLRFLQSRQKVCLVSARILPCETLELNFSKSPGLIYTPTSTMFINVPSISTLQWHPFTISSNCNLEPDTLSVIIKKEGSWTQKLYQILSSPLDHLNVSVEGPYGPPAVKFLRHETLVMVSGGSGITPFISIIRELTFRRTNLSAPLPKVILISAFRTSADLTMLNLLQPISGIHYNISRLQFKIEAFVTREKETPVTTNSHQLLQTICFKPSPSDSPISSVLGPNNWLWLGAIISTSFMMFLVLLGILSRCYIYPIDHNTGTIFPTSSKAFLNTLFIFFCIAATASAVTLWNRKQNRKERNQIQSTDSAEIKSPFFSDQELESIPHQFIVENTKVQYGARPDLKKMLMETKGSSVGVLVSGPKEMRHDVAAICSSGLANHLHFEAVSFNW